MERCTLKVEKTEFDKNFYDDEFCKGCFDEFDGLDNCIIIKSEYGIEAFLCIECFKEFRDNINKLNIEGLI